MTVTSISHRCAGLAVSLVALAGGCLATSAAAAALATKPRSGLPTYSLLVEPRDGMSEIYRLVTSARRSVDMTMYELSDTEMDADLAADASRGVRVRVLLDQNLERAANTPAFDYLKSHGVKVRWAPPSYAATHQKTITVDDAVSIIMTLNLTSRYYATTRDFAVIDRNRADVAAIEEVFDHDFAGDSSSTEPKGSGDLVWSPGSDGTLVDLIDSARHSLYVENEEMSEYTIVDALEAAARRGVHVDLVMTYERQWASNLEALAAAGVHVRVYPDTATALYIHAKVIAVDPGDSDQKVFVGSENFSWESLEYNRELGIILGSRQGSIIAKVADTVKADWSGGRPFG